MKDEETTKGGDQSETSADDTQKAADGGSDAEKDANGSEDYHAKELERLNGSGEGSKYTPLEKATHAARKIAAEIKKYGGDPSSVFGAQKAAEDGKGDTGADDDVDARVSKLVEKKFGEFQSGFVSQQAQAMIRSVSKSESEATLIQYHLENTIRLSGNMEEDVKRAYLIANHGKILQNIELFKAQAGKKTSKVSEPGQKTAGGKQPTDAQKQFMARKNLKWDADKGEMFSPARRAYQEKTRRK
jgi:hypothetical protein